MALSAVITIIIIRLDRRTLLHLEHADLHLFNQSEALYGCMCVRAHLCQCFGRWCFLIPRANMHTHSGSVILVKDSCHTLHRLLICIARHMSTPSAITSNTTRKPLITHSHDFFMISILLFSYCTTIWCTFQQVCDFSLFSCLCFSHMSQCLRFSITVAHLRLEKKI